MKAEPTSTKPDQTQQPGKPYTSPKLVQYGNIRDITKALGGTLGKNDGGGGNDKTG